MSNVIDHEDKDQAELVPAAQENDEETACPTLSSGFEAELELGRLVTDPPPWAAERPDILDMLKSRPGHLRFALTGGIAGGKSTIVEIFERLGVKHIDFDRLAREAVQPSSPGLEKVLELLGQDFADAQEALDRPKTARAVFSDPEKKAALEAIIHPLTWDLMAEELRGYKDEAAVAVSVPLLFEAGLETFFSPIVMVFASADTQLQRLMARNPQLSRAEAEEIIGSQWPAPPKVMGSTYIINNNGQMEESVRQTEMVWREMTKS